jgi:RNA polymerase sigma factor (sigma-70 family)
MDTPLDMTGGTGLFGRLAAREAAAFGEIVTRLRAKLLPTARQRLEREPELHAIYDADDALQSALSIMWFGILSGEIDPPGGADDFLRLARTIIRRRITAKARAERGPERNPTPHEASPRGPGSLDASVPDAANVFQSDLPLPEAVAIAKEETRWLMSLLGPELREVVHYRFIHGLKIEQIAERMGLSPRTISRRLQEIQQIWQDAIRKHDE